MRKRNSIVILAALLPLLNSCTSKAPSEISQGSSHENGEGEEMGEDVWYGAGFYYGIWFSNENDYWNWRDEHPDYPPNHKYYNKDHPVHYHPAGGDGDHPRDGDDMRGRDEDREMDRGGGMDRGGRGGGGRR